MKKRFKDLNLCSSFLFAAALSDPDTCRIVLEIILGRKISKVNIKAENSILLNSDAKWVRLDINARDEFNVNYDIEAENHDRANIARRSRFYQAEMDVAQLAPGDGYGALPDSYVIFICTFDPFGKGLYRYTFTEKCEENGMPLGDGTCKIFFNTKGINAGEVPQELIHFLKYFEETTDEYVSTVEDKSIEELHRKVTELKRSRQWEADYVRLEELLNFMKEEAKEEMREEVKTEVREEVKTEVREEVRAEVKEEVRAEVKEEVRAEIEMEVRKEQLELGRQIALANSVLNFLSDKGNISEELQEKIMDEKDINKLNDYIKLAVTTNSIEEFLEKM